MRDWAVVKNGVDVNHCEKQCFDVSREVREVHEERGETLGNPS